MRLPKAEEQIMQYLWKLENAFMKDLLNEFPEPKPATTTVATLLRRMTERGVIGYKQFGSVNNPVISVFNSSGIASARI